MYLSDPLQPIRPGEKGLGLAPFCFLQNGVPFCWGKDLVANDHLIVAKAFGNDYLIVAKTFAKAPKRSRGIGPFFPTNDVPSLCCSFTCILYKRFSFFRPENLVQKFSGDKRLFRRRTFTQYTVFSLLNVLVYRILGLSSSKPGFAAFWSNISWISFKSGCIFSFIFPFISLIYRAFLVSPGSD